MTRDEIIHVISSKDDDWLESRWSVLNEAIIKIEPLLAEVEAAFDYDYTDSGDTTEASLEKAVCDQVLALCNIVTIHDTEGTMSWGELLEIIDLEIKRRERLDSARELKGQPARLVEIGDIPDGVSMKIDPPAEKPSGILSLDPEEISELVAPCPECGDPVTDKQSKCPHCGSIL